MAGKAPGTTGRATRAAEGPAPVRLPPRRSGEPEATLAERSSRALRPRTADRLVRIDAAPARPAEEHRLELALRALMPPGKRLCLQLTDNRYTMISVRRRPDEYTVRAHRMFAGGEPRLVRALARYVVHNDPRASRLLGEFIEANQSTIKSQPRRRRTLKLRTLGRHHDLQAIFDELNVERFGGKLDARITWGPNLRRSGRRKSIKMGSYAVEDRLIRIHPALDRSDVPRYFVAWIVFHEMLHGKHEAQRIGGRRWYHTKEFMEEERSFSEYDKAVAWERDNIDSLLVG